MGGRGGQGNSACLQNDGFFKSFGARRGPCSAAVGCVSGFAFQIGGVVCEVSRLVALTGLIDVRCAVLTLVDSGAVRIA